VSTRTEVILDTTAYAQAAPPVPFGSPASTKEFPLREMPPVILIIAVDFMGLGIVVPLLPYYTERTGASAFTVGLLISVFAFCQFLAGPVLGQLSDRVGRKPILIMSQLGSFVGYVVFALSHSLWLIFLSRIVDGLSAGNMSVAQAYVSDNTSLAERTRGFGLVGAAFGVGMMIGPALGGLLSTRNLQAPLWAAAGLSLLSVLLTWLLLPTRKRLKTPHEQTEAFALRAITKTFTASSTKQIAWLMTAFYFALSTYMSGQALFLAGHFTFRDHPFSPENIGLVFTYVALINILVQIFLMKTLTRRFSEEHLLGVGFVLMASGFGGVAFCNGLGVLLLLLTVANIGASILRPLVLSQLSKRVDPGKQGSVMGVNQSVFSVCAILAPLLSGGLINRAMYSEWAIAVAVFGCLGLSATLRLRPKETEVLNK
jgi:multidrug resistance protein